MSRLINNILYRLSPECKKVIRLKRLGRTTEFNILKQCVIAPPPKPLMEMYNDVE